MNSNELRLLAERLNSRYSTVDLEDIRNSANALREFADLLDKGMEYFISTCITNEQNRSLS